MNLRRQLLIVSLFTLILPWAGCEFIRETESALRIGQQQMLAGTARAIADSMQQYTSAFPNQDRRPIAAEHLYGHTLNGAPTIDGYFDDWALGPASYGALPGVDGPIHYVFGVFGSHLYLFANVADRNVVYRQPDSDIFNRRAPFADQIVITSSTPSNTEQAIVFSAEAPGLVVAYRINSNGFASEPLIRAVWQDVPGGIQLEARIPRSILGSHLGFTVNNTASASEKAVRQSTFNSRYPGRFMTKDSTIQSVARSIVQPGMRLRVTDNDGWRIADVGEVLRRDNADVDAVSSWLRLLYGALVEEGIGAAFAEADPTGQERSQYVRSALEGEPAASWFRSASGGSAIVSVAEPVLANGQVIGSVILQQGTDEILSLTNRSLARLLNVTVIATVVVALLLLGYASWLSRRIRRLSVAAEQALESDRLRDALPSSTSGDEIGDLSRSFSNVLVQLHEYNEYLRNLASKLSHELRTPLAIVTSSLENLEHERLEPTAAQYSARARDGAGRLRKILAAMSEANRVEELMHNTDAEDIDLAKLLSQAVDAYRDVYPDRRFAVDAESPVMARVSPELIVQMLDKLVDNAVDFSRAGNTISLSLANRNHDCVLSVHNPGPPLPDTMRERLFDSMVSVRGDDKDEHLGLGLHIARLVAEGHRGKIYAENSDDGVRFVVVLPKKNDLE